MRNSNKYTLAYNNIGQIGSFFEVAAQLINNSITVVLAIFLLSKYSILMTVILLIVAFFQYYLNQKHKVANWSWHIKSVKENREKEYYKSVLFSRDQSKELRIFNIYNFFRGKFSERQKKLFEEQQGLVLKGSLMNFGWSSFNIIVSIIFSLYVILQLPNNNSYNVGDVLLIIGAMTSAQNCLFRSADLIAYIKKWCLDGTHVVDFFKEFKTEKKFVEILDKDNQNYSDIIEKYKEDKGIRFYNVSYTYPETKDEIIHNMNLFIPSGASVAFVGHNGAGKTTLVHLMTGLYMPTNGIILLDGKPLRNYRVDELQKRFTVLFQDFIHYKLSMKENITLTNENTSPQKINKIIKDVDLMSVIDKIPNGIETILSPEFGGIDLSAGQWQKVALSRALYHDGDIVIMDEPTAMMDAKMEHRMFQIYKDMFRDKTTVIISHRFSNVKNCDIIFVMKDGFLIETGSHNDLIELNKIYKEMYDIQKTMYDNFEKPENAENYNELDGLFKRSGKI